jgi:transposase-like protein
MDLRAIFNTPNREESERLLRQDVNKYEETSPRLSRWMEENINQWLTIFNFPVEHQKRLRTTNLCERVNGEIKRRTRVVSVFPNARSLERLVTAVLMEMSEDWQSGARYLTMS